MRRREVLKLAGAAWSGLAAYGSGGRILLGANTAITGMGFFDAVKLLREIGFAVIEIQAMGRLEPVAGAFPGYQFDKLSDEEKQRARKALSGVERITAHLPYAGLEYFSADKGTAEAARRVVETAIEGSAYFGAVTCVVHPKPGSGLSVEQQWPEMVRVFRRWGDQARGHGMKLALETGFPKSVKDFVRLIQEIDHPAVGATLDVGHQASYAELAGIAAKDRATPRAIRAYNDVNLQLVGGLRGKLFHLHVHDIDPASWKEHRPMQTGFIDYPRLIAKLREIGFDGSLVLEIGAPAAEMPEDLRHARKVLEGYLRATSSNPRRQA